MKNYILTLALTILIALPVNADARNRKNSCNYDRDSVIAELSKFGKVSSPLRNRNCYIVTCAPKMNIGTDMFFDIDTVSSLAAIPDIKLEKILTMLNKNGKTIRFEMTFTYNDSSWETVKEFLDELELISENGKVLKSSFDGSIDEAYIRYDLNMKSNKIKVTSIFITGI